MAAALERKWALRQAGEQHEHGNVRGLGRLEDAQRVERRLDRRPVRAREVTVYGRVLGEDAAAVEVGERLALQGESVSHSLRN